jgi:hypothetical protein
MSDTWLRFIPTQREYVPSVIAQERAVDLLRTFVPNADAVEVTLSGEIEFIDCGSNWSGVVCSACGLDAEPWFGDALTRAHEQSAFRDLDTIAPCCGAAISLDKLNFGWPVGFARFVLEARNPGLGTSELSPSQYKTLEQVLGCSLGVVWRHL